MQWHVCFWKWNGIISHQPHQEMGLGYEIESDGSMDRLIYYR